MLNTNSISNIHVIHFISDYNWDINLLHIYVPEFITEEIINIPINGPSKDEILFTLFMDGNFKLKTTWETIRIKRQNNNLSSKIWANNILALILSYFGEFGEVIFLWMI